MILLDPSAHPVIGHRGNRAHAPENTLESICQAVALGADAVEFDVHLSRDGTLVVMHDPTLDRTTSGTGPVATRTIAELRALDAGAKFTTDGGKTYPYRGRGVTIPTFDEVMELLPRELPFILEVKTPAATSFVSEAVRRHGVAKRIIVAGFDGNAIHPLRGQGFALGASTGDVATLLLPSLLGRRLGPQAFQAMCIPPMWNAIPVPILAMARSLRGSGTVIHVWTINEPSKALHLWRGGVHGIISDDPALMLAARNGV